MRVGILFDERHGSLADQLTLGLKDGAVEIKLGGRPYMSFMAAQIAIPNLPTGAGRG
jgi:hypothetical protein